MLRLLTVDDYFLEPLDAAATNLPGNDQAQREPVIRLKRL